MRGIFPPNRWGIGFVAASGAGILAFVHSRSILQWAYADVAAVSAEYRQSVLTAGIFVAAVAAWTSSSISSPTAAFVPAGALRRGGPLVLSNLSFLSVTTIVGFTVGLAPVTMSVALQKTAGSFDIYSVLSGYACLLAYLAVGYLIGSALPSYLAVPIALGCAYAVVFLAPTVLSPIFEFEVISGVETPTRVSIIRTVYFLACVAVAGVASGVWLRLRTAFEFRVAAVTVATMAAPLVFVAVASASYSGPLAVPDEAEPVCEQMDGSAVCVHPARSELLHPLAEAVLGLNAAAGPEIFPRITVYDATLTRPDSAGDAFALHLQGQSDAWLTPARVDLAGRAAGLDACFELGSVGTLAADVSSAVGAWILFNVGEQPQILLQTPGAQAQYEQLQMLGSNDAREAIERRIAEVRQCRGEPIR